MLSQIDIYCSAAVLIREHDDDDALEAASRADSMLEKGDVEGQAVWKRILAALQELQSTKPPSGQETH